MTNVQGCGKNLILLTERVFTEHFYEDFFFLFNGIYGPMDIKNNGETTFWS